jgi:hypothetical protein
MKLLIVIVNYRSSDLTIDCLRSLADQVSPGEVEVVITDNASGDGSVEKLQAAISLNYWSAWARVMPLDRNGGFSFGNNAAIRPALNSEAPPSYFLLLNPDTVVLHGALQALLEFMDDNTSVGIAGSRLEHTDGTPQISAFRFPSLASEFENGVRLGLVSRMLKNKLVAQPIPNHAVLTDWVAGASMIIRRAVFEKIGLMDEGYFMYFEEVDFCLRARQAGWPCWYVPSSRIIHLVGQSSGVTDLKKIRNRVPAYWFQSRQRYFRTHFPKHLALSADFLWFLGYSSHRIRLRLQRKQDQDPEHLLRDFLSHALQKFS